MYLLIIRTLFLLIMVATVASCANRPADLSQSKDAAQQVANQKLEDLQFWALSGKLAIINNTERNSAYIAWQQTNDTLTMTLTTIVGTTIAKLSYDGQLAKLNADGQTWQSDSPSQLIFEVTGWQVPVESLSIWMKGQVRPNLVNEYYENGLVKQMSAACDGCLPWLIRYNSYAEFLIQDKPFTLPTSMRLEQLQTKTTLILRIDNWKENNA